MGGVPPQSYPLPPSDCLPEPRVEGRGSSSVLALQRGYSAYRPRQERVVEECLEHRQQTPSTSS